MQENQYDVVIVGGGISGLTAAYTLRKKKPDGKLIVIEGKDRVGGRTLTVPLVSAHGTDRWDVGGQWVGKCQIHVIRMLQELGLETYPQYITGQKLQQLGGSEISSYSSNIPSLSFLALIDLYRVMAKFDKYWRQLDLVDPFTHPRAIEWDALSLAAFLDQCLYTKGARDAVDAACRVVLGCEPSQVSLLFYLVYVGTAGGLENIIEATEGTAQESKIKGGAQEISLELAKRLGKESIRLHDPVKSIQQSEEGVQVTTASGWQCKASYIIIAAPPKAMDFMSFEPPLSSTRRDLIKRMPLGSLTKIIITYQMAFWRDVGLSGEVVSNSDFNPFALSENGPVSLCYDASSENSSPALVAFIGGDVAVSFAELPAKMRQAAVLSHLSQFFGPQVYRFLDYVEKDWNLEPCSWGSPVSYIGPGGMHLYSSCIRRPEGRVHFAGTEAATIWGGYMSGAIQAGEATALAVLQRLSPSCLSSADLETLKPFAASLERPSSERGAGDEAFYAFKKRVKVQPWGVGQQLLVAGVALGGVVGVLYAISQFVKSDEVVTRWH